MSEAELELYALMQKYPELIPLQKAISLEMDKEESFEGRMSILLRYLAYNFEELEIELRLLDIKLNKILSVI